MAGIDIITSSDTLEAALAPLKETIGQDYEGYRGHLYRVLTYSLHFLGGDQSRRQDIEIALVYHDVGMWTDGNLAYLEPSIARFRADCATQGWGVDQDLVEAIIYWHHKTTPYKGPHADVVNAVRKADWIDASKGMFKKGMPKAHIDAVVAAIPLHGFHDTLNRLAGELADGNMLKGLMRVLSRVYKW